MRARWGTTLLVIAGAALAAPAGASAAATCAPAGAGGDWPVYGGTLDSHRAQTATDQTITPANVGQLGLKWKVPMPNGGKIQSVPTEADGCVFTGTDLGDVVAI